MRLKSLFLAGLCLAGLTSAGLAQAPYIFAVDSDATYSAYRDSSINEPEDQPSSLYDPLEDPYQWPVEDFLDIRVEYDDTVTGVYWSALEEWDYTTWPGYCVLKNYYARSNHQGYPVHDHYQPISSRSIPLNAPSYSNNYVGTELIYYDNPYRRSIYVPVLKDFANSYYVVNGSAYSAVTWYVDGTCYIYNG